MSSPDSIEPGASVASNARAVSVSELSSALKRTLEDAFGFVRVRAEISRVTRHASGHVYLTLKDDKACIDAVIWKTQIRAVSCRPEAGLEVVATGRITTYAQRSSYQLVIEALAPAGVGALLAQLERLKAALRAEGLFAPERKKPLPYAPAVVAVITSPTGAVIRDVLHRISERWPTRVVVWPAVVQGPDAARQVREAIAALNRLPPGGPVPRPDVIIVARGGGSVEDLWPFNDEALARAAAASRIPLVSAVGHETDVTLIDYAADRRAPTPTAAAEMTTPVLSDLRGALSTLEARLVRAGAALIGRRRDRLAAAARGLPRPADVLGLAAQRFDAAHTRLASALRRNQSLHETALLRVSARLSPAVLARAQAGRTAALASLEARLERALARRLERAGDRLSRTGDLLRALDPDAPLRRGFLRARRSDGTLARRALDLSPGERLELVFQDGERGAKIEED